MKTQDQKKGSTRPNRRRTSVMALALLVVVAGLVLWIWNSVRTTTNTLGSSQKNAAMQTNEGGQVTIKVTWQGRRAGPVFTVEMDSHTVDLDSYDLRRLAVLRTNQGQEIQPSAWNAPAGGHHRAGMLTFPAMTASGTPVIGPETRSIELMIRNVSGVPERSFRWTP
jgi:hypothetical protein